MKQKVLITVKYKPHDIQYLKESLAETSELIVPEDFTEEGILPYIPETDILVGDFITEKMLQNAKNLKFIQVPQAGVDNLDWELLKKYKYTVANTHSNAYIVAEFALGLILAISKKIVYHDKLLRENDWNMNRDNWHGDYEDMFSDTLYEKTFALIGYGNIGQNIGKLLAPFHPKLKIIVRDKTKRYPGVDFVGDHSDLKEVLSTSDYVVCATPLTPETKGLINETTIGYMKPTAYLINVGRGPVIDEGALYNALAEKKIKGAAIDTWYQYKGRMNHKVNPAKDHDFSQFTNLIMSPHRAAQLAAGAPYFEDAIWNINNFSKGQPLKNILDLERGY